MSNSPFEIFRKNLKPMMVVLTLLALFAFVVLPALQTYLQQSGGGVTDAKLASFNGIELKQSRITHFTRNHAATVRFLTELAQETIARGGQPKTPGFSYDTQTNQVQGVGIDPNPSDFASIRTLQYSAQASDLGFELDDTAISTWLTQFTDGTLSDGETIALLMQSTRNQMGKFHLYDQLRHQLLAELYQRGALAGVVDGQLPITTPVEQWENFLKLNRQATASAYAVMTQDFLEQTNKNPGAADIRSVYEEGKERYPNDQSPEPGFRRRDSATFEYLVANLQSYVDREAAKFTDEQLKAEYERRLAGGDFQLPVDAPAESPADAPAMDADAKPAAEVTPAVEEKKATEKSAGEEKPAAEAPAEPATEQDAPAGETDAPSVEEKSLATPSTSVRLVVFQDDESDAPADPPAETSKSEAEVPAGKETPAEKEPTADKEAPADKEATSDQKPSGDQPAEAKPEMTKEEPAAEEKTAETKAIDDKPVAETKPVEKSAPKVESFEDVKEQIADQLALPEARRQLDAAVQEATSVLRRYFNEKSIHESDVKIGRDSPAPVRPDFKELAQRLDMETKQIGPHTGITIDSESISQSFEPGTERFRRGYSFPVMMFGVNNNQTFVPAQQLFSPLQTVDDQSGKSYVSWKIDSKDEYIPELDEVREEVIMAIRMKEARKLAREAAEALAKQANEKADAKLSTIVPEGKEQFLHEDLGPFSWMNSFGFGRATIGNVPQLDNVGAEFMRKVFTNDIGEAGVAPNQSERVFYVVQPNGFQPPVDELRQRFLQPQERMMAMMLGNEDAGAIMQGFYKSVDDATGFEFTAPEQE